MRRLRWALLVLWLAPSASDVYFVGPSKSVAGRGKADAPFGTLELCVERLRQRDGGGAGGECRLLEGVYRTPQSVSGLRGTADRPVVIAAAAGAAVIHDGTAPVPGATDPEGWRDLGGGRWSLAMPPGSAPVQQLFIGGEMGTPARWPMLITNCMNNY